MGNLPEYNIKNGKKLDGTALNLSIGIIASSAFLMFGYDQGVMSGLLTLNDFQRDLPLMTPDTAANALCEEPGQCQGSPSIQAAGVAVYQVGCMFGALLVLFYGDGWGRRSSTFWGSLVMILGTIFQAALGGNAATSYALFVLGRVIGGIGNGVVTSTIPTWQSECAKPHQRGMLIMLSGCLIAVGIAISYWVNYGFFFLEGSVRWRFPIMFQSFFTIIVMVGLLWLPDSPRWLMMQGRRAEAVDVIARLAGSSPDDAEVRQEVKSVEEAIRVQTAGGGFKYSELLDRGPSRNLQRATIAILAQFAQQITGINVVTYYLALLLEDSLGRSQQESRLIAGINGTEYALAALIALPLVERSGRRKLMLIGLIGMCACMAAIAGCVSTGTVVDGVPELANGPGIAAVAMIFLYNSFFAVGWLGMTWLYPAEISNLRTRIQVNALSTLMNWASNFLIVMITPPMLASIGYQTYIVFAVFNAALFPMVYFFFPETKGRTLEELDVMFASAKALNKSAVKHSLEMPRLLGEELDRELNKYFESPASARPDEEHGFAAR
ncbi:putative sugar transporter [Ceraceosorus guamensis]|uniref:Putative sugar transporter n=1 Tax=Ceraceosorus guamensis TaxID=1522189 RepID=A0A316W0B6_9BASI|nr:putative sugar transporter [Ceraceosorus guamensis]PWN42001.1 putative sugar transporter [Ceraceosorus guamensis]